jgi:hypothetical protein
MGLPTSLKWNILKPLFVSLNKNDFFDLIMLLTRKRNGFRFVFYAFLLLTVSSLLTYLVLYTRISFDYAFYLRIEQFWYNYSEYLLLATIVFALPLIPLYVGWHRLNQFKVIVNSIQQFDKGKANQVDFYLSLFRHKKIDYSEETKERDVFAYCVLYNGNKRILITVSNLIWASRTRVKNTGTGEYKNNTRWYTQPHIHCFVFSSHELLVKYFKSTDNVEIYELTKQLMDYCNSYDTLRINSTQRPTISESDFSNFFTNKLKLPL